jgi:threonine dehydratase
MSTHGVNIGSTGLTWDLIQDARARIEGRVHRTPVMTSHTLDSEASANLFFKCENFQSIGAFKARGATNAIFALSEAQVRNGVATHSSGNHAAAVARAARLRGVPAYVVMPNNTPMAKQASVARYGGKIVLCEPTRAAREKGAEQLMAETGAILVHPFDDYHVMAGQGTTAVELLEDVPDLDAILVPISGGGLISGIAVAAKSIKPTIRVIGVEPAGADDAFRSFRSGKITPVANPQTIADGLRGVVGNKTFPIIQRYVDNIVTVSEDAIVAAMRHIWEVMKIVVEPSGAVTYAGIYSESFPAKGQKVGVVVSGGNLDLDKLPWLNAS